ncbi:MAG: hypothetical protein D8M59_01450 [Planctomycetes bacterium]|nr:hypothetical protein [Planctomycetota bacterium]NOG54613.1 hypothetical protein [Planctomycetota bacterium]
MSRTRFYVSNESYPELREVQPKRKRHVVWWRAFRSAAHDVKFWRFLLCSWGICLLWLPVHIGVIGPRMIVNGTLQDPWKDWVGFIVFFALVGSASYLALTWGGDIMRPHLRRVEPVCREACPGCGHRLTSQIAGNDETIQCPECGRWWGRSPFEEPYQIKGAEVEPPTDFG